MSEKDKKEDHRCGTCGNEIPPGSSYCIKCGRSIRKESFEFPEETAGLPEVKETKGREEKSPNTLLIALMIAVLILIIVIGAALSKMQHNTAGEEGPGVDVALDQAERSTKSINKQPVFYPGKGGLQGPDLRGEAVWMKDLGGTIVSPPAYSGGIVYVVVEEAREMQNPGSEMGVIRFTTKLNAIDAGSGDTVWRSGDLGVDKMDFAEILIDVDRIYVIGNTKRIGVFVLGFAADGSNSKLWSKDFLIQGAQLIGAALAEDVIAVCDISRAGKYETHGIGTFTGQRKWHMYHDGRTTVPAAFGDYISQAAAGPGFGARPTGISNARVKIIRGYTGLTLYDKEVGYSDTWSSPVMVGNRIITAGQWAAGRLLVECYDTRDAGPEPLWQWDEWLAGEDAPIPGVIVLDGKCIFNGPGEKPVMLDMETGESMFIDFPDGHKVAYPPVSNGGQAFFLTDLGIAAVNIKENSLGWIFRFPHGYQPVSATNMACGDGRLFCPGKNGILLAIE